jgi:hypothetical protein
LSVLVLRCLWLPQARSFPGEALRTLDREGSIASAGVQTMESQFLRALTSLLVAWQAMSRTTSQQAIQEEDLQSTIQMQASLLGMQLQIRH